MASDGNGGPTKAANGAPSDDPASETSPSPSPVPFCQETADKMVAFIERARDPLNGLDALEDKVKALEEKSTKDDAKIAELSKTIAELEKQVRVNRQKAVWFDDFMAQQREEQESEEQEREAKRARAE